MHMFFYDNMMMGTRILFYTFCSCQWTVKGGSNSYNLGVVLLYFQLLQQFPLLLLHMVKRSILLLWLLLDLSRQTCVVGVTFCCWQNKYDLAAAVSVAKKETWRRTAIWNRVRDFQALTGIPISSPIISVVVGSEEKALQASRFVLSLSLSLSLLCEWKQLLTFSIIVEQAFAEIWFPCDCNQTPNSAFQFMQVCCSFFTILFILFSCYSMFN